MFLLEIIWMEGIFVSVIAVFAFTAYEIGLDIFPFVLSYLSWSIGKSFVHSPNVATE